MNKNKSKYNNFIFYLNKYVEINTNINAYVNLKLKLYLF